MSICPDARRPLKDVLTEAARPLPQQMHLLVLGANPLAALLLAQLHVHHGLERASFTAYEDPGKIWQLKQRFPDQFPELLQVPRQEEPWAMDVADLVVIASTRPEAGLTGARASRQRRKPVLRLGWLRTLRTGVVLASSPDEDSGCCVACVSGISAPRTPGLADRVARFACFPLMQLAAGTLGTGPFRGTNAWLCDARTVKGGWVDPNPDCLVCGRQS